MSLIVMVMSASPAWLYTYVGIFAPFELSTKVRLARVDGDEIRVQREDAFDVRVE